MTPPHRAAAGNGRPKVITQEGAEVELYDLSKACEATIAEALSRPVRFTYKGGIYEIPNQKLWPLQAQAEVAETNDLGAFFEAIGAEDGDRLLAAGLNNAEFETLMEHLAEEAGVETVPNSSRRRARGSTRT